MAAHTPDPSGSGDAPPLRFAQSYPQATRRAVITGGLVTGVALLGALVGCAPEPGLVGRDGSAPTGRIDDPAGGSVTPEPTAAPASTEPTPPIAPDLEAIVAAHEGLVPTRWGVDIPGVVRTGAEAGAVHPERVFLTLDACGGPAGSGVDTRLIDTLRAASVPALLFLNHRWITTHPALAAELAADPLFTLGNHGTQHMPLSVNGRHAYGIPGTASVRMALDEVWVNHVALTELTGTAPQWFRPGTAHLDDVALSIVEALGERVLGFTVNGDAGATYPATTVAAEVGAAPPSAVVIAHFNQPHSGTADGLSAAIATVRARGLEFGAL